LATRTASFDKLAAMTAPTNHYVTVTDRRGKQIRGKVVYIQPKEQRWREESAEVHIVTSDWLDPYAYPAVYVMPAQSVVGTYAVHSYISEGDQWRFMGIFNRDTSHESAQTNA
jgi:hypothetical protein